MITFGWFKKDGTVHPIFENTPGDGDVYILYYNCQDLPHRLYTFAKDVNGDPDFNAPIYGSKQD